MTDVRPPTPRSAHRLVVFVLDANRCADATQQSVIEDAITTTMVDIAAGPGGPDYQFAAVVFGGDLVRVIAPGTSRPWPLDVPCRGASRIDGALVAVTDLAQRFLDGALEGLPASVEILALVVPGQHLAEPDDLRIRVGITDGTADLAGDWADTLADLQARRLHTVLLR